MSIITPTGPWKWLFVCTHRKAVIWELQLSHPDVFSYRYLSSFLAFNRPNSKTENCLLEVTLFDSNMCKGNTKMKKSKIPFKPTRILPGCFDPSLLDNLWCLQASTWGAGLLEVFFFPSSSPFLITSNLLSFRVRLWTPIEAFLTGSMLHRCLNVVSQSWLASRYMNSIHTIE